MNLTLPGQLKQFLRVLQVTLFPVLKEELGPLTEKHRQVVSVLNMIRVEAWIASPAGGVGRPLKDRRASASALSASRIVNLYDLMDSAYDAKPIHEYRRGLGHVPVIDANPRRDAAAKVEIQAEEKRLRLLGHQTAAAVRHHERTTVERVNARLKDEFRGQDGAGAWEREGDVPSNVRGAGVDGGPDSAAHNIARPKAAPENQAGDRATRTPETKCVEERNSRERRPRFMLQSTLSGKPLAFGGDDVLNFARGSYG